MFTTIYIKGLSPSVRYYGFQSRHNSVQCTIRSNGTWPCVVQTESLKTWCHHDRHHDRSLWHARSHLPRLTMEFAPSSLQTPIIPLILTQWKCTQAYTAGNEICPLDVNTSVLFVHKELTKSHSILDLSRGVRPRPTALNLTLLYWSD